MRISFALYVLIAFALTFNTACERHASPQTRISLQIPAELQEKMQKNSVSSSSALKLQHIALQITGADLKETILVIADAHEGQALPTELSVEVPPGDRLIQLVAAYGNDNSDSAHVYYGDVKRTLRGGTEHIDLPVAKLGGAGASAMTRVTGRYLTSATSGPTGELRMVYRPPGKPGMTVDTSQMRSGWFELSLFQDVPVDYVLDSGHVVGSQWTAASISPQVHLIRVTVPAGYERIWQGMTSTLEARDGEEEYFGFLASNPAFLADKKVCVTSKTPTEGTLFNANRFYATDPSSTFPYRHYETGTTPVPSSSQITIAGGLKKTSCGALNAAEEFHKHLWFLPRPGFQYLSQGIREHLGIEELFAYPAAYKDEFRNSIRDDFNRHYYSASYGGSYVLKPLLPGVASSIEEIQVYGHPTMIPHGEHCDRLDASWVPLKKLTPSFQGNNLVLKKSDFADNSSLPTLAICLKAKGQGVGRLAYVQFPDAEPASHAYFSVADSHLAGQCRSYRLHLSTQNWKNPYLLNAATFTILAELGGASYSFLHAKEDCSDAGTATLPVTMNPGDSGAFFYVKSPATSSFTLSLDSGPAGFTLTASTPVHIEVPDPSLPASLELSSHLDDRVLDSTLYMLSPRGCYPLKIQGYSALHKIVALDGVVTLDLKNLDDTPLSPPAGFAFYTDCSPTGTELLPPLEFNFADEARKTLALRTADTVPKNIKLVVSGMGVEHAVPLNIETQASKLAWNVASLTAATFTCQAVQLRALNEQNTLKTVQHKTFFNVDVGDGGNRHTLIFTDSGCSSLTTPADLFLEAGTSQKTFYVMPIKTGTHTLSPFSLQVPSGGVLDITATPTAFTAAPVVGSVTGGVEVSVWLQGGSAPYSVNSHDTDFIEGTPSIHFNSMEGRFYLKFTIKSSPPASTASSIVVNDSSGTPQVQTINFATSP